MLTLMYITNNPDVALIAEKYGVDRVWVDLETIGKKERQGGINSVISNHTIEDVSKIAKVLSTSELLVRVNPWHEGSVTEIERVIADGADIIMLPMWKSVDEVKNFLDTVNHRTKTTLLLETKEAEDCLDDVLRLGGMDEIHIGLNDLHLSYGLTFMFQLLTNGTVERICKKLKKWGGPYGFGGIACLGEGVLPADRVIMEHYRLGSTRAILSRSFCNQELITEIPEVEKIFRQNMSALRAYEKSVLEKAEEYSSNQRVVAQCVEKIVAAMRREK